MFKKIKKNIILIILLSCTNLGANNSNLKSLKKLVDNSERNYQLVIDGRKKCNKGIIYINNKLEENLSKKELNRLLVKVEKTEKICNNAGLLAEKTMANIKGF